MLKKWNSIISNETKMSFEKHKIITNVTWPHRVLPAIFLSDSFYCSLYLHFSCQNDVVGNSSSSVVLLFFSKHFQIVAATTADINVYRLSSTREVGTKLRPLGSLSFQIWRTVVKAHCILPLAESYVGARLGSIGTLCRRTVLLSFALAGFFEKRRKNLG